MDRGPGTPACRCRHQLDSPERRNWYSCACVRCGYILTCGWLFTVGHVVMQAHLGVITDPGPAPAPRYADCAVRSWPGRCSSWPATQGFASSSTSAPACPPAAMCTRWPTTPTPQAHVLSDDIDPMV